jgi:hypothetical protein
VRVVGCGDEGTASFATDAVRKLTTSYGFFTFAGNNYALIYMKIILK